MSARSQPPHRVAVIGPGSCNERQARQAETIGRRLAEAGVVVLCGGLAGVMDAVARGATAGGGISVGFLPHAVASVASEAVTLPLATGLGEARNVLVVGTAEVVIAIGGGVGTLSEMALAWKSGKPVVTLDSWRVQPPEGTPTPETFPVSSAEEAVTVALGLLEREARCRGQAETRDAP